ncbi:MAG: hypothetical protein V1708_01955 [Candidatus Micrarchaeota archaeon]
MKLSCSFCSDSTECSCPDSEAKKYAKYPDAKFACPVCSELLDEGVPEAELKDSPKRAEAAALVETEQISAMLAEMVSSDTFEQNWGQAKDALRTLSKKELAQESYYQGLHAAFAFFLTARRQGSLDRMLADLKKDRHPH